MKINCDKVLTVDNFDVAYASWKERTLTIMGDYIKVTQIGLQPRYYDTVYLFEETGLLIGFKYGNLMNECYLTTKDGQESDSFADAMPYIFNDCNHSYAVVKRIYRNTDLRKQVIGLGIIDVATLIPLYSKKTWPIWEDIISIHNGAVLIKKKEESYGLSTLDKFPTCNLVSTAFSIKRVMNEDNAYVISRYNMGRKEKVICDFTKQLSKLRLTR